MFFHIGSLLTDSLQGRVTLSPRFGCQMLPKAGWGWDGGSSGGGGGGSGVVVDKQHITGSVIVINIEIAL